MYDVYIESAAERDIKRLPEEIVHRFIARLRNLSKDPRPDGCRKIARSKSDWRIRVGNYRIIYEINDKEKAVRIMRILHRKTAYRF